MARANINELLNSNTEEIDAGQDESKENLKQRCTSAEILGALEYKLEKNLCLSSGS